MEAGWCDSCGKKIPQHLLSAAVRRATTTPPEGARGKTKRRWRAHPLAILVIFAFLLVGTLGCAIVYMRASKEPSDLGAAVKGGVAGLFLGGILGVWVSRGLGLLGKRADED
jgi:hypothetical protein